MDVCTFAEVTYVSVFNLAERGYKHFYMEDVTIVKSRPVRVRDMSPTNTCYEFMNYKFMRWTTFHHQKTTVVNFFNFHSVFLRYFTTRYPARFYHKSRLFQAPSQTFDSISWRHNKIMFLTLRGRGPANKYF